MDKVMVTGSAGFLGAHAVTVFLDKNWSVLAGVRSQSDCRRLERLGDRRNRLTRIPFDLSRDDLITQAVYAHKPRVIVHCAAYGVDYRQQDFRLALADNVNSLPVLLKVAADVGVERVIHIGSAYQYGAYDRPVSEHFVLKPQSIYAASKAAASIIALERAANLGLPLIELRPFTMFGPWEDEHKFVPQVINACRNKQHLELTAGEQIRDFIYVTDVAKACVLAASTSDFPAGEVINIGSGQATSLRTLGNMIADEAGGDRQWLNWGACEYRPDELMYCVADISKAQRLLNWTASTPLPEAIANTINYS